MTPAPSGSARTGPSAAYLRLVRTPVRDLEGWMRRGTSPSPDALTGWEWRGTNLPASSRLLGIRRFVKGFVAAAEGVSGYNVTVPGADLDTPWRTVTRRDGRREWAHFRVTPVDPEARDNRYLDALLLDYGAGAPVEPGVAGHLRDYLVRVHAPGATGPVLLGRAMLALGTRRVPVGWFVLERLSRIDPAPGPGDGSDDGTGDAAPVEQPAE